MANIGVATVSSKRRNGNAAPFVRVTAIRKAFGSIPALQGIDFDVPLGCTVSLLGPSGCGKTTMLRSIAGLETPNAGRISIGDTVVFDSERMIDLPSEKRQIGMVFQSYAVWPHMTVGQNVGFPLKIRRVPAKEIKSRVRDVLSLVGLDGFADRPSTNLSGGQQQRVALARAIVHEPRLVLFDEPLSNLDAKLRQQMRTELKLLQGRLGFTAIYVTHDQEEALALSDTVIVMNQGRVEAIASPRELFTKPRTPFVASFVGFDNLYDGKIDWVGDGGGRDPMAAAAAAQPIDVAVGGLSLRCFWYGDAPPRPGMPVTLAFRSERVSVRPSNAGERNDPDTNQYEGIVEACVYLGKFQDCVVATGSLRVHAIGPANAAIAPGDRVTISIRPDECIVFRS
jgi:ABC-type Fe3+/spermidine/putrescine transport system ATPase subunit